MVPGIAQDSYLAAQSCEIPSRHGLLAESEIAKVIDNIIALYDFIPIRNYRLVHFVYMREWPIAILDDIRMSEMAVRREPGRHSICHSSYS